MTVMTMSQKVDFQMEVQTNKIILMNITKEATMTIPSCKLL